MNYITVTLPFNACSVSARLLLSTAGLFRIAVLKVYKKLLEDNVKYISPIMLKKYYRSLAYGIIPNRRYADGALALIWSVYESCEALGIPFNQIEWKNWLMFQQTEKEFPCRNITLRKNYDVGVSTISFNGGKEKVELKPIIPTNYMRLINYIIEKRIPYTGRVVLRGYGERKGILRVNGRINLTIPYNAYLEVMKGFKRNYGKLYGGIDVNMDRINLAIIDGKGKLRDTYTFWFREVTARGYPRRRARTVIGMRVHEMLRYAYYHGVKVLFLENPGILGKLKLLWIRNGRRLHRNYNWKVSVFRSSVIEMIALKAPLYSIKTKYVDPKGTTNSREHDTIMKKHRLDKHTASAYMIALKGLNNKFI